MTNILVVSDLIEIRHKYVILSLVGLILVPSHVCDSDDPPTKWWVIHLASFKIGIWCPFPKVIDHAVHTFDIKPTQLNPNGWKTLMCLSIVAGEHEVDLTSDELWSMYCLKNNDLDKGRVYISYVVRHELHLKLSVVAHARRINIFILSGIFGIAG